MGAWRTLRICKETPQASILCEHSCTWYAKRWWGMACCWVAREYTALAAAVAIQPQCCHCHPSRHAPACLKVYEASCAKDRCVKWCVNQSLLTAHVSRSRQAGMRSPCCCGRHEHVQAGRQLCHPVPHPVVRKQGVDVCCAGVWRHVVQAHCVGRPRWQACCRSRAPTCCSSGVPWPLPVCCWGSRGAGVPA